MRVRVVTTAGPERAEKGRRVSSGRDLSGEAWRPRPRPRETAGRRQETETQQAKNEAGHKQRRSGDKGTEVQTADRAGRGDRPDSREPEAAVLAGRGVTASSVGPGWGRGSQGHGAPWGSTGVCGDHSLWGVRELSGGSVSGRWSHSGPLDVLRPLVCPGITRRLITVGGVTVSFKKVRMLSEGPRAPTCWAP